MKSGSPPAFGPEDQRLSSSSRRACRRVHLHPPQRRRVRPARVGQRAGAAENEVDPADPRQLLGRGDQERRPDLLGPRLAAAHLPPEDDRHRAPPPAPAAAPSGDRAGPARSPARRLRPAAGRPRAWRPGPDPPPSRRPAAPARDRPRRRSRPARRRSVLSSDGTTAGDLEKFTASRRGVTSPCPAPMSLSASPAANGPSACSVFPRNFARSSLAAFSLALALSGNDSPPAVHQQRRPGMLGRPHQRGVTGDVPQRIAGAAARLERPADVRPNRRVSGAARRGSAWSDHGPALVRRRRQRAPVRRRATRFAEQCSHGRHYGNRTRALAIPDCPRFGAMARLDRAMAGR